MPEAKKRVLLAEDDTAIRTLGQLILEADGLEVTAVQDGESAIPEIRKGIWHAVITDFNMMPHGLTGADVAREAVSAGIKRVLIATANPGQVPDIKGVKIIPKPFSWKDIVRILKDTTQEPSVIQEYSAIQGLSVSQATSATQGLSVSQTTSAAQGLSAAQESSSTQGSSANEGPPTNQ